MLLRAKLNYMVPLYFCPHSSNDNIIYSALQEEAKIMHGFV